jgi:DNA-binding CsgD family transcriptional regulator
MVQQGAQGDATGVVPERQALFARVLQAATTPGRRVMLVGEPGIGKTYLVDALLQALGDERTVLWTRATEGDRPAFAGLRDLLSGVPDAAFRHLTAEQRSSVLAVLGRGPGRRVEMAVLQAGVTAVVAAVAGAGATVVVDEWQWLDQESRRVLERALLRRGAAVSVVGARRADGTPDDLAVRPLFAPTDVVPLTALAPTSVQRVLADAGLGGLPASVLAEVVRRSEGNPLWAIQLAVGHDQGVVRQGPTSSVTAAVAGRLAALPAAVREVLQVVAVLGSARLEDLEAVRPGAGDVVADGLGTQVFRQDAETVTAGHPLLAAAALEALSAEEERAVHAAVAELPMPASRRLEHQDAGTPPGEDERLARELARAAGRAQRAGATETALRLARRAVSRTGTDAPERPGRVADAVELALATGDDVLAVEIAAVLDLGRLSVPVLDRVVAVVWQARDRIADRAAAGSLEHLQRAAEPGSVRWHILESWRVAVTHADDPDVLDRLLALVDELPVDQAPRTRTIVLHSAAYMQLDRGRGVDEGLVERVRAVERIAGLPVLEDSADGMEAVWPYQADDLARSRSNLTLYVRAAKGSGETYAIVQGLAHATIVETLAGRLGDADALLQQTEQEALGLTQLPPSLYRARAMLALARDDRAALGPALETRMSPAGERRGSLLRAAVTGLDHAYSDRWDEALEHLEVAYAASRAFQVQEPGRRLWIDVELVRALVHVGDVERAAVLTSDLAVLGDRPGRTHARGQALRLQALLAHRSGDHDLAARSSADGIVALRRGGFRPELLRAQLEQVEMAGHVGQHARARSLLVSLGEAAARVGDPRLIGKVAAAQERLDDANRRTALTPAELRVAQAAAVGRSNREIAAELFLSIRTVETHLASVYRKVGVRTRTQLALHLHES